MVAHHSHDHVSQGDIGAVRQVGLWVGHEQAYDAMKLYWDYFGFLLCNKRQLEINKKRDTNKGLLVGEKHAYTTIIILCNNLTLLSF